MKRKDRPLADLAKELKAKLATLNKSRDELEYSNKKLTAELEHIRKISGQSVQLDQNNQALQATNDKLEQDIKNLTLENSKLTENTRNEGIKLGIAAIVLGILAGLALPYLKTPRRGKRGSYGAKLR